MDFKIITLEDGSVILLERIEEDNSWQVIISTYVDKEYRYDEWAVIEAVEDAQRFIQCYSDHSAQEFRRRANVDYAQHVVSQNG